MNASLNPPPGKPGRPPRSPVSGEQEELLHDIYYNRKLMYGRDKIFKMDEVQKAGISRRQVYDWLSKQEIHQRFLPAKEPRDVQPTIVSRPHAQVEVDLMDMSTYADTGYHWIMTGIDLFSKKGYAVPMKNKTEKAATAALQELLKQINSMPSILRTDNGSEFITKSFAKVLKDHQIDHVFGSAGKPQSQGQVERFNAILKGQIKRHFMYTGKNEWVSDLPSILNGYNSTYQRIIKKSPDAAEADGEKEQLVTAKRLLDNVISRRPLDKVKLQKGDQVRVRIQNIPNEKRGENWSAELYKVDEVFKPKSDHRSVQYSLEGLKGRFFNDDLQKVSAVENPVQLPETFIIGKFVRPALFNGTPGYLVHWKGFKESEDTVEPRETLLVDVPKMVKQFEKKYSVVWTQGKNGRWGYKWSGD